jgi:hypothetical protein
VPGWNPRRQGDDEGDDEKVDDEKVDDEKVDDERVSAWPSPGTPVT